MRWNGASSDLGVAACQPILRRNRIVEHQASKVCFEPTHNLDIRGHAVGGFSPAVTFPVFEEICSIVRKTVALEEPLGAAVGSLPGPVHLAFIVRRCAIRQHPSPLIYSLVKFRKSARQDFCHICDDIQRFTVIDKQRQYS